MLFYSSLRHVDEYRIILKIKYVEGRKVSMHQPGLVKHSHIFNNFVKKILFIFWDLVFKLWRNVPVFADELQYKHIIEESHGYGNIYSGIPCIHKIPILPLDPCHYYLPFLVLEV